jgi:hypothetical protein
MMAFGIVHCQLPLNGLLQYLREFASMDTELLHACLNNVGDDGRHFLTERWLKNQQIGNTTKLSEEWFRPENGSLRRVRCDSSDQCWPQTKVGNKW